MKIEMDLEKCLEFCERYLKPQKGSEHLEKREVYQSFFDQMKTDPMLCFAKFVADSLLDPPQTTEHTKGLLFGMIIAVCSTNPAFHEAISAEDNEE